MNRVVTPWVIVQCHRAWKESTSIADILEGGPLNCRSCRSVFESILIQYNIDIYLSGHVH